MAQVDQSIIAAGDPDALALRRARSTLWTAGTAVIAFSLWSLIRTFLCIALGVTTLTVSVGAEVPDTASLVAAMAGSIIGLAVNLALRLYVGRSARAVARGQKRRRAYLVLAVLMAAALVLDIVLNVGLIANPDVFAGIAGASDTSVAVIIFDVGALIALVDLLVSAKRVGTLTKKQRG